MTHLLNESEMSFSSYRKKDLGAGLMFGCLCRYLGKM